MVALKLQRVQYSLQKKFLQRLVFPMLFGGSDGTFQGGRFVVTHYLSFWTESGQSVLGSTVVTLAIWENGAKIA